MFSPTNLILLPRNLMVDASEFDGKLKVLISTESVLLLCYGWVSWIFSFPQNFFKIRY